MRALNPLNLILAASLAAIAPKALGEEAAAPRPIAAGFSQRGEVDLVHYGQGLGPEGLSSCLADGRRRERILCAHSARYARLGWAVLPVLVEVLEDHDRIVASRAAESMVVLVSELVREDMGPQEVLPEEVEELLEQLGSAFGNDELSVDVRAQALVSLGVLAVAAGAGLEVAREAYVGSDVAIRRAAVSVVVRSDEPEDLDFVALAAGDGDAHVVALAVAATCEATVGRGQPMHSIVLAKAGWFLRDPRARLSLVLPLLACIARAPDASSAELRELARQHPNEACRRAYAELRAGDD